METGVNWHSNTNVKKFKYNNDIYNLRGYKLTISGRTNKRNMMTTIERYSIGNMPVQYMKKHIEYSFNTAETRLGTLGLKLWFFFKKKKRITKKNVKQYVFSKNIMYVKKKLNSVFNVHNVFTKKSTKRKSKQKKKNTRYPTTLYVNKTRNTILPAWKAKK